MESNNNLELYVQERPENLQIAQTQARLSPTTIKILSGAASKIRPIYIAAKETSIQNYENQEVSGVVVDMGTGQPVGEFFGKELAKELLKDCIYYGGLANGIRKDNLLGMDSFEKGQIVGSIIKTFGWMSPSDVYHGLVWASEQNSEEFTAYGSLSIKWVATCLTAYQSYRAKLVSQIDLAVQTVENAEQKLLSMPAYQEKKQEGFVNWTYEWLAHRELGECPPMTDPDPFVCISYVEYLLQCECPGLTMERIEEEESKIKVAAFDKMKGTRSGDLREIITQASVTSNSRIAILNKLLNEISVDDLRALLERMKQTVPLTERDRQEKERLETIRQTDFTIKS